MSEVVTHRFTVEAGFLVRRQIINEITGAAWREGIECSHERAGRTIRFTMQGEPRRLQMLTKAIARWIDECNEPSEPRS